MRWYTQISLASPTLQKLERRATLGIPSVGVGS
jgi:hypothetical protein